MKKQSWKKNVLLTGIVVAFLSSYLAEPVYHPEYEILTEEEEAFASYQDGFIYIGDRNFLCNVDANEGDILIWDERSREDPNFKIYDSYEIHDKNIRNDILEVLCCYEECYPSEWDRSIESMRLEWALHNLSYDLHYERKSSTDVDLNNSDEEKYDNKILRKFLRL